MPNRTVEKVGRVLDLLVDRPSANGKYRRRFLYQYEVYGFLFYIERKAIYGDCPTFGWEPFFREHGILDDYDNYNRVKHFISTNRSLPRVDDTPLSPSRIASKVFCCAKDKGSFNRAGQHSATGHEGVKYLFDWTKKAWENRESFRCTASPRKANRWKVLDQMEIDEKLKPVRDFFDFLNASQDDENVSLEEACEKFVCLFDDLANTDFSPRDMEESDYYWCLGEEESNCVYAWFEENRKRGFAHAATFDSYVQKLASSAFFSNLGYRTANGIGSVDVSRFIERKLIFKNEERPLASIASLEGPRLRILTSCAGGGKTASLIALVRSFSSNQETLSEAVGFTGDQNLSQAGQVPFFFLFNSLRDQQGLRLADGTGCEEILRQFVNANSGELPAGNEIIPKIKKLGQNALFILDALDEAQNLSQALDAVMVLMNMFRSARFIVSTRPVATKPAKLFNVTDDDVAVYCLKELDEDQKVKLIVGHLKELSDLGNADEGELENYAKGLVGGKYTQDMISTPLFASGAAQRSRRVNGKFIDFYPCEVFGDVVDALLDKTASVFESFRPNRPKEWNRSEIESRAEQLVGKLALALFLNCKIGEGVGYVAEDLEWRSKDRTGLNSVGSEMRRISEYLSFPEKKLNDEEWKQYLVASGLVSCSPDAEGGQFFFDNRDMQIYLAARALSDLVSAGRPGEAFKILRGLLLDNCDKEVGKLAVMLLSCDGLGKDGTEVLDDQDCIAVGHALEILNCVINCLLKPGEDDDRCVLAKKREVLLESLMDIKECKFCESPFMSVSLSSNSSKSDSIFIYRDVLDEVIEWLKQGEESGEGQLV